MSADQPRLVDYLAPVVADLYRERTGDWPRISV
jgi:hypothetical protein